MSVSLHVLIIEDSEDDAQLILRDLRRGKYDSQSKRIETEDEMRTALREQTWDVILSDYSLPQFNAPAALAVLQESGQDIPFIIVSGTIGEDIAVEALKAGAHDFILKGNTARLLPAVERELREAQIRQKHKEAEEAVIEAEKRFRALIEHSSDALTLVDENGTILFGSPAVTRILGYPLDEWVGQSGFGFVHPDELPELEKQFDNIILNGVSHLKLEVRLRRRDGSYCWVGLVTSRFISESGMTQVVANFRDITKRKQSEAAITNYNKRLETLRAIDRAILSVQSAEKIAAMVLQFIQQQINVFRCSVILFNIEANEARLLSARIDKETLPANEVTFSLDTIPPAILGLLHNGQPQIIEDKTILTSPLNQTLGTDDVRATVWIPLITNNELIGTLNFVPDTLDALEFEHIQIAREIADQLAIGIQQANYRETIEQHNAELEQGVLQRTSELRQAKEEIESILNNSSDTIILANLDGIIQQINPAATKLFGYSPEEVIKQSLTMFVELDAVDITLEAMSKVVNDGQFVNVEIMARRKNGTEFYGDLALSPVMDNSTITGLIYTLRDITERKEAALRLQESEEQSRATFEQAAVGIARVAPDGSWLRVNQKLCDIVGYTHDELLKLTFQDITHPDDIDADLEYVRQVLDGEIQSYSMEKRYIRKDKSHVWTNLTVSLVRGSSGKPKYFISVVEDIAIRKHLEQAIAASEEKYRVLVESAEAAISMLDLDGTFTYLNPAAAQLFDGKPEDFVGKTMYDLFPSEVAERQLAHNHRVIEAGQGETLEVQSIINGQPRWFRSNVQPLRHESGEINSVLAIVIDITERIESERALQASEAKYRALIDFAPDPIVITDETGRIVLVNRQVPKVLGFGPEDLIGQPVEKLIPEHLRDIHVLERTEYMRSPTTRAGDERSKLVIVHKNGASVPVRIGLSPIQLDDELLVMSYIVDISTQQKLEESLRSALAKEKELNELKSRFVSLVSHEFKTPLAVILSATDTLRNYSDRLTEEKKFKRLDSIRTHVKRLSSLLDDTITLTRADTVGVSFNPTLIDLEEFCGEIITEIQFTCQATHEIVFFSTGERTTMLIDTGLLQHALINLLSNAVKYSPEGGTVLFELVYASEEITIRIKDKGIGIPASEQDRLFEAFHRANNVGDISGTGLGLVITKQSIEAHGGTITFESQEGAGTTFIIKLPRQMPDFH